MDSTHRTTKAILTLCSLLLIGAVAPASAESARSYLFQTVLVVGSNEGASDLDSMPDNVVKALDDVRRFLPYKSYRVLDTSLVRSAANARGMLTSPTGQEFALRFQVETREDTLMIHGFELDTFVLRPQDRVVTEGQNAKIEHSPPKRVQKGVIATSFTVAPGETIVVGTSKLNGSGQALIVLFTAMP